MTADELVTRPADLSDSADRSRDSSMLRNLWWRLCLKPYGDALCTPGAAFWIFSARIAIFVMAAAEAISWSYLGYYIGQSSQPYVTAAIAGLAIFSVIWIVDASFITLDTSRSADEAAILGRTPNPRADRWRLAAGLLIRAAIISATLLISAPFLAQLVFFRDITAEMNRRDSVLIAQKRAEVAASFDARAAELALARRALDAESIREAAGAGPSRRIGRGPVVATIEKRLADLDAQAIALQSEKANALRAYDALGRAELQQRYGLQFAEDGIRTRGEVLASLRTNETYANAELAIRGFLAFLILALIVLKLFQPASVSVYFSETLQDVYAQYRAGAFDACLPPAERSYARVGLTPLRFKAWCMESYRDMRTLALRNAREAEAKALRDGAEAARGAVAELQNEIRRAAAELEASREQLTRQEHAVELLRVTLRSGVDRDTFVRGAEAQASIERDIAQTRALVRSQEAALADLTTRVASREQHIRALEGQVARLALPPA